MKLEEFFTAVGSLPKFQEIEFNSQCVFVLALTKLLAQKSVKAETLPLLKLSFRYCTFVNYREDDDFNELWKCIGMQSKLTSLVFGFGTFHGGSLPGD